MIKPKIGNINLGQILQSFQKRHQIHQQIKICSHPLQQRLTNKQIDIYSICLTTTLALIKIYPIPSYYVESISNDWIINLFSIIRIFSKENFTKDFPSFRSQNYFQTNAKARKTKRRRSVGKCVNQIRNTKSQSPIRPSIHRFDSIILGKNKCLDRQTYRRTDGRTYVQYHNSRKKTWKSQQR